MDKYYFTRNRKNNCQFMKKILISVSGMLMLIALAVNAFAGSGRPQTAKYRFIHNNDGSDLLGNIWFDRRPLTLADLDSCVDLVTKDTPITTYMICSGSEFSYVPSKYGRIFGDDLNGTLSCGTDTLFHRYYDNAMYLQRQGTDLIKATLSRAKANGKETFITYRVNDLHFNDTTMHCPIYYTKWWLEHPQFWVNDPSQGWHSAGALDFTFKEVRDHKLAIISEQLDNYADYIDGYELDFLRFFVYCKTGQGAALAPQMTQWMRKIRQKVNEVSAREHKKILLTVRVAPTVEANLDHGLDVKQWLKEGLIDFITIGTHMRIDPEIPVGKFRKDLGRALKVPLYASVDGVSYKNYEPVSQGMYRGTCSYILSHGADGMYLFNYYLSEYNKHGGEDLAEPGGEICRYRSPKLMAELGSLKTMEGRNKIYSLSEGRVEYGMHPNTPLPLDLAPGQNEQVSLYVADDVKSIAPEEVILFLRTSRLPEADIRLNGSVPIVEVPGYARIYDRERGLTGSEKVLCLVFPSSAVKQGENIIRFKSADNNFTIIRVELALKFGDVDYKGLF